MKKHVGLCVLAACITMPMAVQAKTVCLKFPFGAYAKIYGLKNTAKVGASSAVHGWIYSSWWTGPMPTNGVVVGRGDGSSALHLATDARVAGYSDPVHITGQAVDTKTLSGTVTWDEVVSINSYSMITVPCKEADAYLKDNL